MWLNQYYRLSRTAARRVSTIKTCLSAACGRSSRTSSKATSTNAQHHPLAHGTSSSSCGPLSSPPLALCSSYLCECRPSTSCHHHLSLRSAHHLSILSCRRPSHRHRHHRHRARRPSFRHHQYHDLLPHSTLNHHLHHLRLRTPSPSASINALPMAANPPRFLQAAYSSPNSTSFATRSGRGFPPRTRNNTER